MKTVILSLILCVAGCAQRAGPRLSAIEDAPASVREAVRFDFSDPEHPIEHYTMHRRLPPTDWIDLGADFQSDGVFIQGFFAYDDSGKFEPIERLRVDTGLNGFLGIALAHDLSGRIWVSDGYGERESHVLQGKFRTWRGVGTALSIGGVSYGPVPVGISEMTDESIVQTPLLGQEWFELAQATWIDPRNNLLAVSFRRQAVDDFLADNPEGWVSLPWRIAKPNGHRFVPLEIAGVSFEAIIDTGMSRELFLDTPHPPSFIRRPWKRGQVVIPSGGVPILSAISNEPVHLDGFEVAEPMVMWLAKRSPTLFQTPGDRPFATLGIDFLRRFPVLLDPKNDRAYFFVGDRAQLVLMWDISSTAPIPNN